MSVWTVQHASARHEWGTPPELIRSLGVEFEIDLCAQRWSSVAPWYYGLDGPTPDDGWPQCLGQHPEDPADVIRAWTGRLAWCNPPYGRQVRQWLERCRTLGRAGVPVCTLVLARTDTAWWHDIVYGEDGRGGADVVRLIRGRVRFVDPETREPGQACPAPSALIWFDGQPTQVRTEVWDPWFRARDLPNQWEP